MYKAGGKFEIREIPFAKEHGTRVFVQDLFYQIPARKKFLKSDTTERNYIKQVVMHYALVHRDKSWILKHNGKVIRNLAPGASLLERVLDMTKKSWEQNLKILEFKDSQLHLYIFLVRPISIFLSIKDQSKINC